MHISMPAQPQLAGGCQALHRHSGSLGPCPSCLASLAPVSCTDRVIESWLVWGFHLRCSMAVLWGSCCAVGTVIPPAGRAAAVQPAVGLAQGGCVEIGSDSHARFLATFDSREAVVPESNVHCQLWGSSLPFSSSTPFTF